MRRNIFVTTCPKAGTHYLLPLLSRITGHRVTFLKPASVTAVRTVVEDLDYREFLLFSGHRRFQNRLEGIGQRPAWFTLVLIRDPRDIVLSLRDNLERKLVPRHAEAYDAIAHLPRAEQLKVVALGIRPMVVAPIWAHCSGFLQWRRIGAQVIRYEEIGEPAFNTRLATLLATDEETVRAAVEALSGQPTRSLNVGRKNRWQSEMDDELLAWFRENDGGIVERLGYAW